MFVVIEQNCSLVFFWALLDSNKEIAGSEECSPNDYCL